MTDQPLNPDPDAAKPGPEDSTRRDSEAMLRGKPPQDPLIGTKVDQYSIKRVIGEGGMGVVYEALQQSPPPHGCPQDDEARGHLQECHAPLRV